MPTLLLAEHDNKSLKDATNKALTAAKALGGDVHILVAGAGCKAVADAAAKLDGVKKVLLADAPAYAHMLAEPTAALIVSLAEPYETIIGGGDHDREERHAARGGAARRDADFRRHQGRGAGHVRAPGLCRQRHPDRALDRAQEGDDGAHRGVPGDGGGRFGAGRGGRRRGRSRHLRFRRRGAVEIGAAGADLGQDHHFRRPGHAKPRELHQIYRAGGRQARRRGRRLARRGRRRLRAERLAGRADRQGRGARTSISPSASPVLSSTSPA